MKSQLVFGKPGSRPITASTPPTSKSPTILPPPSKIPAARNITNQPTLKQQPLSSNKSSSTPTLSSRLPGSGVSLKPPPTPPKLAPAKPPRAADTSHLIQAILQEPENYDQLLDMSTENIEDVIRTRDITIQSRKQEMINSYAQIKPVLEYISKLREEVSRLKERRDLYKTFASIGRDTLLSCSSASSIEHLLKSNSTYRPPPSAPALTLDALFTDFSDQSEGGPTEPTSPVAYTEEPVRTVKPSSTRVPISITSSSVYADPKMTIKADRSAHG